MPRKKKVIEIPEFDRIAVLDGDIQAINFMSEQEYSVKLGMLSSIKEVIDKDTTKEQVFNFLTLARISLEEEQRVINAPKI